MEPEQLKEFEDWFDTYVASFYGDDSFVNVHLKLKEDHSKRVCEEMAYLTGQLALEDNQKRIARTIALFHDIGRFSQFAEHRTYNDTISVNHCLLALDVLQQAKLFDKIAEHEKQLIEKAIQYHNLRQLPADLDGDCLMFSQLIRDADKLDIFHLVIEYHARYIKNPDQFELDLEFPDSPTYSPEIIEEILNDRRVDYKMLRTFNDMKLLQLAWVYDINFPATFKQMKKRKFLEMMVDFLPQTNDIERVKKKVFDYVDLKIKQKTEPRP